MDASHFHEWEVLLRRASSKSFARLMVFLVQVAGFGPEQEILEAMKAIEGVSSVETQTYTFMDA